MCEKCQQVDAMIGRYRRLLADVADDQTAVALLSIVLTDLESEKTALHPKPDK
jgi:hypothetical protein